MARLLGYPSPRPVDDALYASAIEPADRASERRALDIALNRNNEASNCTYRLNGVDGTQRIVVSSGQGFFDESGALEYFVGVLSDITQATQERARAQDRALFAEQMVGIVSHDLRNPLSAILTRAKVLAHGETPPNKLRVLGHVTNSAMRAKRLIEQLLDFTLARVGRGLTISPASVDLHALVAGVVDELRLAFPERPITHHAQGEGECTADVDRLAQLLGNLVGNAMAYGQRGRAVTVVSSLEAESASLSVHNWGEAIAQEMLASIFEPMVRGDPGEGAGRSVGLGLFIVRAIALAHHGDVMVSSSQTSGTTFEFDFPREW